MQLITFKIDGQPTGKGRPRFYNGHAVTPKKTAQYEKKLRSIAKEYIDHPIEGAVSMAIVFAFGIPQSWTKKKKQMALSHQILPTKKPDIDNCLKIILDALNGVAWGDDCQVVHVTTTKIYSENEPFVRITIWEGDV